MDRFFSSNASVFIISIIWGSVVMGRVIKIYSNIVTLLQLGLVTVEILNWAFFQKLAQIIP